MNLFNESEKNSNLKLDDRSITVDMLKDSKFNITTLCNATSEAINPQLRQIIDTQLSMAINESHELCDIAIGKNWFEAYEDPEQQLKDDLNDSKRVLESE
ncbi:spore coat protein [Clostridium neuense]|uniref:Spore coat protein n=1 Tax=Clostridium neuense TaxID=1728934 RepID=A0ABW8TFG4_9CLOT